MKTALLLLTTLSASFSVASGSVIARWDWDHLKQVDDPNLATCISPCVKVTELGYVDLKQGFHPMGGYKDSPFRSWTGWTEEFTATPEGRADLSPASGTLWFDVSFSPGFEGSISSFDFCFSQLDAGSPRQMQASIYWLNGEGKVEWATTGAYTASTLPGVDTGFTCVSLPFLQYSSPIPSGAGMAGQTIHVEFQAWGGSTDSLPPDATGALALENITLSGVACVVPEPGSAILIAVVGFIALVRRHRPRLGRV